MFYFGDISISSQTLHIVIVDIMWTLYFILGGIFSNKSHGNAMDQNLFF